MKNLFFIILFILLITVFPVDIFASTTPEVDYPSILGTSPQEIIATAESEADIFPLFMGYFFRLILFFSAATIIGVLIYAGLLYMLSTGNPVKTKAAREWILSAIQGALVIFTSYSLLFILDSQLVLFQQRELAERDGQEVDLTWIGMTNTYYQVPFGLLIEDAILNENAKNKLFDVLDATNEAEAVAESIYQGSRQLLAIIESCPIGAPCGPGAGPAPSPGEIPYAPPTPEDRDDTGDAPIPPPSESNGGGDGQNGDGNGGENGQNGDDDSHLRYDFGDGNQGTFYYKDSEGNMHPVKDEEHFESLDPDSIHLIPDNIEEDSAFFVPTYKKNVSRKQFSFLSSFNISFSLFNNVYANTSNNVGDALYDSYYGDDATQGGQLWEPDYDPLLDQQPYDTPTDYPDFTGDDWDFDFPMEEPSDDWNGSHDNGGENGEDGDDNGDNGEDGDDNGDNGDDEEEEEEDDSFECCPPCPDIVPPVQAKIAEIEGYFPIFFDKLEVLLQTKEPHLEDLYQLYKAVMIKSLGSPHLINYNSLLLINRYYEKEEVIIITDDEVTEINGYVWDWSQWLYNILYRIEIGGETITENDPVTFYIKEPMAKDITEDAINFAKQQRGRGIESAGEAVGVARRIPPPPPDPNATFFPPVDPDRSRITSPFGERPDPFNPLRTVFHRGIDLAAAPNTPVYASEKGEVVFARASSTSYGKLIAIYHKASDNAHLDEDFVTYYAHLEPDSFMIREGDVVERGQHIAGVGTTGRSTGHHLHFEVRLSVSEPYLMYTGGQIDPAEYINIDLWSLQEDNSFADKYNLFQAIIDKISIDTACAIEPPGDGEFDLSPGVLSPGDFIECGMEIPIGETFELTWDHLVELLATIDHYISEGERLVAQQQLMNDLSRPCSCPCAGECCNCDPPSCGGCELTCNLGQIRAAHAQVAATRESLRQIAAHIELLTKGHFVTPTEELCDDLNEDIRSQEEKEMCHAGGSKLITKHELITRKLNYSRHSLDQCITRPEHLEDVIDGARAGRYPIFGPLAEIKYLPRYTKTVKDGYRINTSDFNWFCCLDSLLE